MKDVVIIGGGVVGLWCAWHLQRAGRQVTIVDKGDFTDGCSYGNAGMIVPSHFIPMASPGIVASGLRWMFKRDSPFYIRPRLSLELLQWLYLFNKSATKKHVEESSALLRDMHEESRALYAQLNQSSGFNFEFQQKGILMLYKSAAAERDEVTRLRTDSVNARFEVAQHSTRPAVASQLVIDEARQADMQLLAQELRRGQVDVAIDTVLVVRV